MSTMIKVHEARRNLSRLLDQAHAGKEIILCRYGKPYARLMPLAAPEGGRRPGRLAGTLDDAFFEALPDAELNSWSPK